jgi:CheY-like chemotaxis protein
LDDYQSATKKAEQASLAKSDFLANMSHEIRTPMNAIVGLTSILSTHKISPERQRECLNTLRLSAESLMDIINNLLDISKIENESVELENIPFDLCMLLHEVISIMNVKAVEKNITLNFEFNAQLNGEFLGDPTRLKQILMNLLGNAIKFTGKGVVTLRAAPEPANEGHTMINFSVVDTGIGIHQNKLNLLFNKFSQADSTITRQYGGTGLGLAITKKLVELMNGEINVASEIGKGSIFTARIPYTKHIKTESITSSDIQLGGVTGSTSRTQHILLVEDSPANVLVATSMLENLGYKFDIAKDGEEAIEKYKSGKFDLLLMDVQMPRMDGYSATRLIRQHESQNSILRTPIIGVTAHAFSDDREKCIHSGMDDYLSKPFVQAELNQKICQLI